MAITTANRLRKMKKFQDMDAEERGSLKFTDAERTILADEKLLFDEMNSVSSKNAFSIKKKQRRAAAADESRTG